MISNGQTDLLELIQCASETSEGLMRMDAVRRLKKRSLQRLDVLALSEFARKAEDPAWRTTAAQVLGFHRIATSYPDLVDPLKGAILAERDPEARKALAYAVRGTAGATALVNHPAIDIAQDAVAGVPFTEEAWSKMLDAFYAGLSPAQKTRVLRLIGEPEDAAKWVVQYTLESSFGDVKEDPTEQTVLLYQVIDQGNALLTLLDAQEQLERTHQKIWPGLARRERKRVLLDLFTRAVANVGLKPEFGERLASRVAEDAVFLEKQGRRLRTILRGQSAPDGEQLIIVVAHAFDEADPKAKRRLAELMVTIGKELPNTADTVSAILGDWSDAPVEMLLKLRQRRMGIR